MRATRNLSRATCSSADKSCRASKLRFEALEPRAMLSASPSPDSLICHPNLSHFDAAGPAGLSPAQVLHAYGFDQVTWRGFGETIAIVDACDDPTVAADLHAFDLQFGLADPKLTVSKMSMYGMTPTYDPLWAMEISLDVEWAHAIAPKANILLVEAPVASLGSLISAVDYARRQPGVNVVSMSWGGPEFSTEGYYDSYFTTPAGHGNVTFVASSGDSGAPASWPSIARNVLAVGGTTLSLGANNTYGGEAAWSGSGGGYSPYETEPGYQLGVQNTGFRSNPDVAYDATGFSIYDSGAWLTVGGTSAGAPQWAGLIARVNQARVARGKSRLNSAPQAIYCLPKAAFHDITVGSNGYAAGVGYDPVTGRGSPTAQFVIRDLIAYKQPAIVAASATSATLPLTLNSLTAGQYLEAGRGITGAGLAAPLRTDSTASAAFISAMDADGTSSRIDGVVSTTVASTANGSVAERIFPTLVEGSVARQSLTADAGFTSRLPGEDWGLSGASTSAGDESLEQNLIDACFADPSDLMGELDFAA
jgi:hypothetical protein